MGKGRLEERKGEERRGEERRGEERRGKLKIFEVVNKYLDKMGILKCVDKWEGEWREREITL